MDYSRGQLEQIDIAREIISTYPDQFELALTDDVLKRIAANGGVVMVTFVPSFLSQEVWDMEETMWPTDAAWDLTSDYRAAWLAYVAKHATIEQLDGKPATDG